MSGIQKEQSAYGRRSVLIEKIEGCFSRLPNEFSATELYEKAGITARSPLKRMIVASVLRGHFRCENVTGKWKKL